MSWRFLICAAFSSGAIACSSAADPEVAIVEQALSCTGLPAWSVRSFQAGERVASAGKAYECKPFPFTGWCGLAPAYEPGVGSAWQDAWVEVGGCDGAPDASDCSAISDWTLGKQYPGGSRVESGGNIYECKPWPFSGWCGIGSAYEPGVGIAWQDAWTLVGPCGGAPDPDPDPDPTPITIDELITTCPDAAELDAIDQDFDIRFEFIGDDPARSWSAPLLPAAATSLTLKSASTRR